MKTVFKSASKVALLAGLLVPGVSAGSLWPASGAGARNLVADRKAAAAGDIVTVVVDEAANAQSSQSKKSSRESSLEDAMGQFLFSAAASGLGTKGGELPATKNSGKSSYSGGGAVNNSQSLTARAAVLVTDVLPNGNLVISGVRLVRFSGETQYVVLHGVIRADDITRENTVVSTNVADARVEFYSEGSLTDAQKRGWFGKLYEKLRPF
jgi:flagellar L-ring protein precursor FlgH